jgi:hypothetical protein
MERIEFIAIRTLLPSFLVGVVAAEHAVTKGISLDDGTRLTVQNHRINSLAALQEAA